MVIACSILDSSSVTLFSHPQIHYFINKVFNYLIDIRFFSSILQNQFFLQTPSTHYNTSQFIEIYLSS